MGQARTKTARLETPSRPVPSKRESIDELWARGELSYLLRPEQRLLLAHLNQAPTGVNTWNLSRRLGKTTTCGVYCHEQAYKNPGINIRYGTAFLSDLEEFILPIFEWILLDCPRRFRPRYLPSQKVFRFPNGSRIKLVGVDKNPNGLRGNAIDLMILDEAAFVKNLKKIYQSVIVPATMKRKFKLIFPSTPPESPAHFWASSLIPKAKKAGTYMKMTIDDISDLPLEERERILDDAGGEWSTNARREFFCEIIVDEEKALAPAFKLLEHVDSYEPKGPIKWTIFGDGGGVRDKTVFLKMGYDHSIEKVLIRKELHKPKMTPTPSIIKAYRDMGFDQLSLRADLPGQLQIDWSKEGLLAGPVMKDDFNAGIQFLNTAFHKNAVLIHPDCELLIQTLVTGLLNNQRTDYERSPELGHCDAAACAIYGLRGVDKKNYWPDGWNLPESTHHHIPTQSGNFKQKLAEMLEQNGV